MSDALRTVTVALGERSYPIHIGTQLLGARLPDMLRECTGSRAVLVTNDTVHNLYGDVVLSALEGVQTDVFSMPDGEAHKSLETWQRLMDFLMQHRHNRDTCIIALGGGVVGDLAGFAAATYQRGVGFVQVPTTLLAQVDSSVGGKTAVNHPAGKNMIGAFYQPRCVVIDTDVLATLPPREYAAGLAEVAKYGVIEDAELFRYLEQNVEGLVDRDADVLGHVIQRSCEIKASVVERDEREGGLRAILNFGHTFGHAIEQLSGYGTWLHGEAVAIGMVMACRFSARLGLLTAAHATRVEQLLAGLQLPVELPEALPVEAMLEAMAMDKKAQDGRIRFVVATDIGAVQLTSDYPQEALVATLKERGGS